jgi:hypothetical protein
LPDDIVEALKGVHKITDNEIADKNPNTLQHGSQGKVALRQSLVHDYLDELV